MHPHCRKIAKAGKSACGLKLILTCGLRLLTCGFALICFEPKEITDGGQRGLREFTPSVLHVLNDAIKCIINFVFCKSFDL